MIDNRQTIGPRRTLNHDLRDAQNALSEVMVRFRRWQDAVAMLSILSRQATPDRLDTMRAECADLTAEIQKARTDLLLALPKRPRQSPGHSRVVDVERALDGIENNLAGIRRQLQTPDQ